jgi:hypothetical protein
VKYEAAPAFVTDWARLSRGEQDTFLGVVRERFNAACERYERDPSTPWPRGLRVKHVQGTTGVWEMTWSFAGPDGRATFEWIEIDGERAIRWRRIGGHEIFGRP